MGRRIKKRVSAVVFSRPIGLLLLLLLTSRDTAATIIVFIVSNDGLVVAADSETRLQGRIVGGVEKIRFPPNRNDAVFAVTQHSIIYDPERIGDSPDPETAPRLWDAKQIVSESLVERT